MPRPPIPEKVLVEAERLRTAGYSWAHIAGACHYSIKGLRAALERRGYKGPTRAEYLAAQQAERGLRIAEAVRLTVVEDLTPGEIARRMCLTAHSVRVYLHSGTGQRLLREALKAAEAEGALVGGTWRLHPRRRVRVWVPGSVA